MISLKALAGPAAVVALALLATPASAALTLYGDVTSWTAATTGVTTVTIPEPNAGSVSYDFFGTGDASVVYDGVTFSSEEAFGLGSLFNVSSGYGGSPGATLSHQGDGNDMNILVTFASAVTSFGTNLSTFQASTLSFVFSNGDTFNVANGAGGYGPTAFYGATSSSGFTSVRLIASSVNTNNGLNLSDVRFGDASALPPGVPEPGAWALMILGFGLAGAALRRGRTGAATA